jgi:hypothetical protein
MGWLVVHPPFHFSSKKKKNMIQILVIRRQFLKRGPSSSSLASPDHLRALTLSHPIDLDN